MENEKKAKRILLIGGGGHCHSVLDSLSGGGRFEKIGIVARDSANYKELKNNRLVADYLVGVDADLPKLFSCGWNNAFVTLGSIGNPIGRKKIYELLRRIGFQIPSIIDETAIVSNKASIGLGVFVGKKAVINVSSTIGDCAIINTGAIVEHDCAVGGFSHVSPGAIICGQVNIGENSHIGAGATVRQGIRIGENVLIGAGSVVVKDIPDNAMAYGNPCKVVD